jgi:copper(I)-binding protein
VSSDTLVSARSPDARRVLLVRDGTEPSRPDGELANIGLPAHAAITFSPFGTDLVLIRPAPVRVGELVPVILIFRKAGHVTIDLTVTDSLTSP